MVASLGQALGAWLCLQEVVPACFELRKGEERVLVGSLRACCGGGVATVVVVGWWGGGEGKDPCLMMMADRLMPASKLRREGPPGSFLPSSPPPPPPPPHHSHKHALHAHTHRKAGLGLRSGLLCSTEPEARRRKALPAACSEDGDEWKQQLSLACTRTTTPQPPSLLHMAGPRLRGASAAPGPWALALFISASLLLLLS